MTTNDIIISDNTTQGQNSSRNETNIDYVSLLQQQYGTNNMRDIVRSVITELENQYRVNTNLRERINLALTRLRDRLVILRDNIHNSIGNLCTEIDQ